MMEQSDLVVKNNVAIFPKCNCTVKRIYGDVQSQHYILVVRNFGDVITNEVRGKRVDHRSRGNEVAQEI